MKRRLIGYVVLKQLYNGALWDRLQGWEVISGVMTKEQAEAMLTDNTSMVPWRIARRYARPK